MKESVYNALLKYAIDKEYQGLTEKEKRKIRKQAKQFVAKDNLLYFTNLDGETRRVVRKQKSTEFFELNCLYILYIIGNVTLSSLVLQ